MSLNPYHYTTQPRHGLGAPGAGDFDRPSYLGAAPGDYGAAWWASLPLWAAATVAPVAAAAGAGAYWYGKGSGSADAAALAAAAQAGAAPPAYTPVAPTPGYTYPPATSTPGAAPPPASTAITDQPWFWPVLIATAGILAFAAFRPRS